MESGWRHASYAVMLAFVLIGNLPLHMLHRLAVLCQPAPASGDRPGHAALPRLGPCGHRGGALALRPRPDASPAVVGHTFFLVIPLAGILAFEAVTVVASRRRRP